ncbi:PfkB family carbohydrate kinase [Embleya sp. NBC_00896]|uniref:carbohydrate kinase family protein n=1 Tax=Embleya sp. NBC_00896 TaxID=2975961 RepID=UPI002F914BD3|nr:PfkB family carbohydrate kinase [Embleya sp. NBC_00896]
MPMPMSGLPEPSPAPAASGAAVPAGGTARPRVLVVGGAGVDTIVRVPTLPPAYADSTHVPPVYERAAHTGIGVALGCHALGLPTALVDAIGDDPHGELVRATLRRHGVDLHAAHSPAGTRRAVNLVDDEGRRMSFFDGRDQPALVLPPDLYVPLLPAVRHVHVTITESARHVYPELRRHPVSISTDLHDWDGVREHHRVFAHSSDVVFLSTAAVPERFADLMRHIVDRGRAHTVVATAGAHGCHLFARGADAVRHVPAAVPPGPVVDSNGAGDAFVAGYLYGLLTGRTPEDCARLGTVSGAYTCTVPGDGARSIDEPSLLGTAARPHSR